MTNMSEAFYNVNRKILLGKLETIPDESEMRMMYRLINNIKPKVTVGRNLVEEILTNIGVVQGDCFSALSFISCLAQIWE